MEESASRPTASEVTAGKWFLVTVRGIRRNSNFRYVARANTGVDGGEIIMQGYRSVDATKTLFKVAGDIFPVPHEDIIRQLQHPIDEVADNGRKAYVRFSSAIDTKEV